MNYPKPIKESKPRDPKLGIKSSLPNPKALLAQIILLYLADGAPSTSDPMEQTDSQTLRLSSESEAKIRDYLLKWTSCTEQDISGIISDFNKGPLLTSQLEPLVVPTELIWGLCEIGFRSSDLKKADERSGNFRHPKILRYTTNMDIVKTLFEGDIDAFTGVIAGWLGDDDGYSESIENRLVRLLSVFAQHTQYRISTLDGVLTFDTEGLYAALSESPDGISIASEEEYKGPVRILKSSLSQGLWPYLSQGQNHKTVVLEDETDHDEARQFGLRIASHRELYNIRPQKNDETRVDPGESEEPSRVEEGLDNLILYGVPGAGKSYAVQSVIGNDRSRTERTVFHPDYSYSDFTLQISPGMEDDKVRYNEIPGPFARVLKKSHDDPETDYYLVIEEINRGNAPAIFGDLFQLLDRDHTGVSTYSITNAQLAKYVYNDPGSPIRIPANMKIVATMNTADQNVFTLDTAFQRRWSMQMIGNDFSRCPYAMKPVLDTTVTWKQFCSYFNEKIVSHSMYEHSTSDKRMGVFFIAENELDLDNLSSNPAANFGMGRIPFCDKVLKYLWDDAFKFNRGEIFRHASGNSFDDISYHFAAATGNDRLNIFVDTIVNDLLD